MKSKIIFVANTGFALYNFRLAFMKLLVHEGYEILAVACDEDDYEEKFANEGIRFIDIFIDHKGRNPLHDIRLVLTLVSIYRREYPTIVHHFTIKPVIYGSIAAKIAKVSNILNTITGLGYSFQSSSLLQKLVKSLYVLSLSGKPRVVFQNQDDHDYFIKKKIVSPKQAHIILGSGVNTKKVFPCSTGKIDNKLLFVMIARMLWSKGVKEFVEAALIVKQKNSESEFLMAGGHSGGGAVGNPESIPIEWLSEINNQGIVKWVGRIQHEEVMQMLDRASVVVLPSYSEGVPKSLIEALAKAKPIITSDTNGCREVVVEGINGFLVPPKNVPKLAEAMIKFVANHELISRMGFASRERAIQLFDEKIVFRETLGIYREII